MTSRAAASCAKASAAVSRVLRTKREVVKIAEAATRDAGASVAYPDNLLLLLLNHLPPDITSGQGLEIRSISVKV